MSILVIVISLILIGVIAYIIGKGVERIKLPSLLGMMIFGMFIGPYFYNIIPEETLNLSPMIKDVTLVTVLFIAGLGISSDEMKAIGRPAVLLSVIPATLEGFTIAILSTIFLGFDFIQGAILGFIIAAVSPAVLIPSMLDLIDKNFGRDKSIPQMLLVGASADDTVAITLFSTFLSIYLGGTNGAQVSLGKEIILIPISIVISIGVAYLISRLTKPIVSNTKDIRIKALLVFLVCLGLRSIEVSINLEIFNSLLSIMIYGFFLRNTLEKDALLIKKTMDKVWGGGKVFLFTFVGTAINPNLVGEYFLVGLLILTCSLFIRSIGVLISLLGTNLNAKERLFCIIAYLPKATVQSAKAGIPLQMGVVHGEVMQAIAILSVLITAPIGAIGIKVAAPKCLNESY
ncbi:cation:proton antiporter [Clostridium sp.]|uniref:cation:proton antiporter domain-containing protein n=1 Tax=Clostridium sp. TaxID=1506 RepID=UPI003463927C